MMVSALDLTQLLAAYHAGALALILCRQSVLAGLTVFCATFSAHMLVNLGVSQGWIGPAWDISSAFGLVYGPALYLFVRGLVYSDRRIRWIDSVHAIPALIIALWQPEPPIPYIFGLPSLVIYTGLALRDLMRHRSHRQDWRADSDSINLNWVHTALAGFAGLAMLDILRELSGLSQSALPDDLALSAVIIGVIALLTGMTLAARAHTRQSGALPDLVLRPAPPPATTTQQRPDPMFERIRTHIESTQAWREPRLSLADIAEATGISVRDVSRAINLSGSMSFSRFIHLYRIRALHALMADPAHHSRTVIDLAYSCGFNSKSAFNRIYRELTGLTPSEGFACFKSGQSVPDPV
ncbi:helix-turn-helix transcriptional regulator [Maricaulis sp. D1M11]|uniref:helix-turn-helix transcriptional regulator n=1 Tax=Maricaulis sp. D1M11 TaxID=3076117 RepID=UPI0039B382BA